MTKKKTAILVGIPLILIGAYFGYKLLCLNIYKSNLEPNRMTILEPYILSQQDFDEDEYFKVQNVSIKNEFDNFQKEDPIISPSENMFFEAYQLKEGDNVKARITFNKSTSYVDSLKENASFNDDEGDFLQKEVPKFMESKNFKNDYEFLKFLSEYQEPEINIFTPIATMKEAYFVSVLAAIYLPKCTMQELKGDYQGYILKSSDDSETNFTEVNIEYEEYKYTIYFLEKDKTIFTDSKIKELTSSIKID